MPHAEIKYSEHLPVDAPALLARIEAVIQTHDAGSGACKGRAYPAPQSHHDHVHVAVSLLPKAHRDAPFMSALLGDITAAVQRAVPPDVYLSVGLSFSSPYYVTGLAKEIHDAQ